jgi:hypothetical protein
MALNNYNSIIKISLSLLILSALTVSLYSQDKKISNVINVYRHVTAIGPGTDNVTLDDVSGLQPKDTILLIQMKGSIVNVPESGSYGSYKDFVGAPGKYEFLIIQSVNGGTKVVVFSNPIINTYDVLGMVQVVKVPYYNTATVTSTLTCQPWDSITKTGGVLTMIVGRTLKLNANIDVTGKGFYGGSLSAGQGICINVNSTLYDKFSYEDILPTNSGLKGESHVIKAYIDPLTQPSIYPVYARGKGNNFTAGGGGNGRYSGGGGGANYGFGGKGGKEIGTCAGGPQEGGLGGKQVKFTDLDGGIFLGSGGGSSTYESTPTGTAGARGGGIIIIMCDTLKGNGNVIKAEGDTPIGTASGNAGAGGGGGGGSIALYQQSFSTIPATSALTISANGGKGGNHSLTFGEGGGGGGGLILTNNITVPANVIKTVLGGSVGTRPPSPTGGSGTAGDKLTTFAPVLNGFLFNSIRSSVTGDQTDSICSNVLFGEISGTTPVGGVAPYIYKWQSSTISDNDLDFTDAPGVNNQQNYTPPALLTQTTWFRRIVTDNGAPVLTDKSKAVKIIVQQAITGNLVGKDTTICYNQNPLPLVPLNSGPANGSSYNYYLYSWIQNNTNTNWNTSPAASGTNINANYDPPALTNTTYYQRVVTSGRCVSYSSTVTITVLPLITGNVTTRPDSVICQGSLFNNLGASAPGGGDLVTYKYQWQDSITSSVWTPAVGTNTAATYTPDTSKFAIVENRYMRRVVFSGPDSVCKSRSVPIHLTRYHKIKNNSILPATQTICSAGTPAALTGSTPINGSGTYTYVWKDSTRIHPWTILPGITSIGHAPGALTDTTWYVRIVNSSKCTNKSLAVIVNVHKPIANFNITLLAGGLTDTTICNGQTPHKIIGIAATGGNGSFAYQWKYSTDNLTFIPVPSAGTGISYQPPALTVTTYYKREVISGACTVLSNVITVNVLPLISNNTISSSQTVCYNTIPAALTGLTLTGGNGIYSYYWEQSTDNGTTWVAAAGTNNSASGGYSPSALILRTLYRRNVFSGLSNCCTSVSNVVIIDINQLPTGSLTNTADTTICGGSQVLLKVTLTGASPWKVTYKENGTDGPVSPSLPSNRSVLNISPASPAATNLFVYILGKVEDVNGCIATVLTGAKNANVYKVPVANAGGDAAKKMTICGPAVTLNAVPSVGSGVWTFPPVVTLTDITDPKAKAAFDPALFTGASLTYKFIWEETNWQCKNKDSVLVRFDRPIVNINAGNDTVLYTFDNVFHTAAKEPETGETGTWSVVSGSGIFTDPNLYNTTVEQLEPKVTSIFKWTVENGDCKEEDDVSVSANEIVVPAGFSPNGDSENDTLIIRGLDLVNQDAELIIMTGSGTEVFSASYKTGQDADTWKNWDGKNSKGIDLPEATYYYVLKLTSHNPGSNTNQVHKQTGYIILKRSRY